jgi:hypothetical protein
MGIYAEAWDKKKTGTLTISKSDEYKLYAAFPKYGVAPTSNDKLIWSDDTNALTVKFDEGTTYGVSVTDLTVDSNGYYHIKWAATLGKSTTWAVGDTATFHYYG